MILSSLKEHRQRFQEELIEKSGDFHYRFKRYQIDYTMALVYITEESADLSVCEEYLRTSDRMVLFQPNFCAIVFDYTTEEGGIKAANNLLSYIQSRFFTKHLYMAVVASDHDKSEFQMVHDLFDLMTYAITNSMNNLVVENSQVIQHQQSV